MRSSVCRLLVLSLAAATLSSVAGCNKKDAGNSADAAASATPVTSAAASAKPKELTFEEKLASSKPLDPKPAPQEGGGVKLTAERCEIEGGPFVFKSNMSVMKGIRTIGDKLYIADGEGKVRGYSIAPGPTCKLTVDKTFGENGILKTAGDIDHLSSDAAGHLYASTTMSGTTRLTGGKVDYKCDARPQGTLFVHPSGKLGIGTFANADVGKLTLDDKGCKSESWAFTNMNEPPKRKGPFGLAQAVGFLGDTILVGGHTAKELDPNQPNVVVAVDATGKEKFRFGNTDKGFTEDRFGWVHAIAPCKPGICVLDSNYRRITFWKTDGKYVGFVKLDKLFDLAYPWFSDFSQGKGGATYFSAGQDRQKTGVGEGNVYKVTGL